MIKNAGSQNERKTSPKFLVVEVQSNKVEKIPLFLREWMDHENVDDQKNPATCFVLSYQDPITIENFEVGLDLVAIRRTTFQSHTSKVRLRTDR